MDVLVRLWNLALRLVLALVFVVGKSAQGYSHSMYITFEHDSGETKQKKIVNHFGFFPEMNVRLNPVSLISDARCTVVDRYALQLTFI